MCGTTVGGEAVEIGSARLWTDRQVEIPVLVDLAVNQQQQAGRTVMIVRHDSPWLGVLGLAHQPRPEAREVLARLREMGLSPLVMLT